MTACFRGRSSLQCVARKEVRATDLRSDLMETQVFGTAIGGRHGLSPNIYLSPNHFMDIIYTIFFNKISHVIIIILKIFIISYLHIIIPVDHDY